MKKVIKRIVIIVLVAVILVGGVIGAQKYNLSKKTAQVVPLSQYGMDQYWGDNIESYGNVQSDQAQTVYLTKEQKILSVNVKEGDEVKAGDVLMTIEKSSVDLKEKELYLQQEENRLKQANTKVRRLEKVKPVLDKAEVRVDESVTEEDYVSTREFRATALLGNGYSEGDRVAIVSYDPKGNVVGTVYYDTHGIETDKDSFLGGDLDYDNTTAYAIEETTDKYEKRKAIGYYGADGKIIGKDVFVDGKQVQSFTFEEGMTAKELAEAMTSTTAEAQKLDLAVRRKRLEFEQAKKTAGSGEIVAKVSGTVTKLQDVNNINYNSSFMAITGNDEFYILGTIGEFYLDAVNVGDTVTVNSWENGATAEATITSISDMPSTDNNGGYGNGQSSSSYEFRASFDKGSGIELGAPVDIQITPTNVDNGIYIYSAFIRKDEGGNYIMKMNQDTNRLEKKYVAIGKKLYGYYTEIKTDDLTMDDYVAFPYGAGAIEGVPCEIVDYLG